MIRDQRDSLRPIQKDRQGLRDQLREVTTKLDAIMAGDVLVTRSQLLRVLEQLRAQGVTVEEREIFTA